LIAVAEAIHDVAKEEKLVAPELFYLGPTEYDKNALFEQGIKFIMVPAGKRRRYFSLQNYTDLFKTLIGILKSLWLLYSIYPDVIFSKCGYASFPVLVAAKILRIPVVIHESDIIPGRVNRWIANYAQDIAVSYPEAINHFVHKDRVAQTGQPIRKNLYEVPEGDPASLFALEENVPVILVLGGSQGSERFNENIIDILPRLLEKYQVIHQTGDANYDWMRKRAAGALGGTPLISRYKPVGFLGAKQLRLAAKAATLIVSRAGSTIFEIALWGVPSIIIPLKISREDHQRENAYSYARTGAATVIEEHNLKPALFFSIIDAILMDPAHQAKMKDGAKAFAKADAADKIAQLLLSISSHHD
jgi:UDP-N-acetylglucosamine--N-acetylmuramyl-(pentapeptide) pyrophosphoryl-undecaprenol N-acetylglucosamine transferase